MSLESNQKLTEIMQLCAEQRLRVSMTQPGSKRNSIERTVEMGEDVVFIQIGEISDLELPELLDSFLRTLKG